MRAVKVTYSNGESITTSINGTDEEILDYFKIGKPFNLGKGEKDDVQTVTKAEILPDSQVEEAIDADGFNPDGFNTSGISREDLNTIIDILITNDISYDLDGPKEIIDFDMTELSKEDQEKINMILKNQITENVLNYSKKLFKLNEGLKLTTEYEGETQEEEIQDDYLADIAKNVTDPNSFVKKVAYGITDTTSELPNPDDKDKLINWFNKFKENGITGNKTEPVSLDLNDFIESYSKCVVINIKDIDDKYRTNKFDIIKRAAGDTNCKIIGTFENQIFVGSNTNDENDLDNFINTNLN